MQKTKILGVALSACIVMTPQITHANDFDTKRIGDLLMVITPAYAFGMTTRESNFDGTIQLIKDMAATQLITEGIKAFELEERPNKFIPQRTQCCRVHRRNVYP